MLNLVSNQLLYLIMFRMIFVFKYIELTTGLDSKTRRLHFEYKKPRHFRGRFLEEEL